MSRASPSSLNVALGNTNAESSTPSQEPTEFAIGRSYRLRDSCNQTLGEVVLERQRDDWRHGSFRESAAFAAIKPLFEEHVELVNNQVFALVDDVESKIAGLGLRLETLQAQAMPAIVDVQIGCDSISFRVKTEHS